MSRSLRSLVVLAGASALCAGLPASSPLPQSPATRTVAEPADLVLLGGKIVTVDEDRGTVEALAARGGRIVAVGTDEEVAPHVGDGTRVVDLGGRLAIPGFIEGHGHFTGIGQAKQILDLTKVRSWNDVVAMVADAVAKASPGEWILGRGWHQEKWSVTPENDVEGFPTHDSLSAVSPENPVLLTHASGHASFANAKAMAMSGISRDTADPAGGEVLRTPTGEPCGVFRETAQGLVGRAQAGGSVRRSPEQLSEDTRRAVRLADQECVSKGVTTFQDAGSSFRTVDVLKAMALAGDLKTRLYVMIRDSNGRLARMAGDYRMVGVGDDRLTVRAIKRTIDGALGARGAWLLEPYSDSPESTGLATATVESVTESARIAAQHGFQLCVHAIGDRANREVLDIFEKTFRANPDMKDARWRVEHAQHIHPDDIPRFAGLDVIAFMQAVHCTSDAVYVPQRLGAQRAKEGAYVWRSLIDSGAVVTNGTDAPVEDVDPIASFYAAVTRKKADGEAFHPEQCMTRMEALKSYTTWCAFAAFEEDLKGSLTPGKLADVVVMSDDIMTIPEDRILDAVVDLTIVGGEVVYERDGR